MGLPRGAPKELGHGAFGAVFLRKNEKMCEVALNVFRHGAERDAEHKILAFLAAGKNLSKRIIRTDVVVPLQGHLQQTGQDQPTPTFPGLIFEYCLFGDVEGFISKSHPVLNQANICHWTSHVAEGLQFLASLHIVHADFKPNNILVQAANTLVVGVLGGSFLATTPHNTASEQRSPTRPSKSCGKLGSRPPQTCSRWGSSHMRGRPGSFRTHARGNI